MPASNACISCELSAFMCSRISASLLLRGGMASPFWLSGDETEWCVSAAALQHEDCSPRGWRIHRSVGTSAQAPLGFGRRSSLGKEGGLSGRTVTATQYNSGFLVSARSNIVHKRL